MRQILQIYSVMGGVRCYLDGAEFSSALTLRCMSATQQQISDQSKVPETRLPCRRAKLPCHAR